MTLIKLSTPKDFFDEVVEPNYNQFMSEPSSFRTAINVAISLFSMHEWIFELSKPKVEKLLGKTFVKKHNLWKHIEGQTSEACYIRDVANASKHVRLTINPSTKMTHIANTSIQMVTVGYNSPNPKPARTPSVIMDEQGQAISFDDCAESMFKFWQKFIPQL